MKSSLSLLLILSIPLLLGASCQAPAKQDEGPVVKVIDGDTFDLLINGQQVRVRMDGIDAPERGMDYYKVSKTYLGDLCMGKQVRVVLKEKDQYQRWVGRGFLTDDRDLSLEMVKAGMAWHFKKYSADAALSSAEEEARSNNRGLWQMPDPMAPWDFRKSKRKKNG